MDLVLRLMASAITCSGVASCGTLTVYFCLSPVLETTQIQIINSPPVTVKERQQEVLLGLV